MANNKLDKDLNVINEWAWDRFFKTGDINCYGAIVGVREVQAKRNKNRQNQPGL